MEMRGMSAEVEDSLEGSLLKKSFNCLENMSVEDI